MWIFQMAHKRLGLTVCDMLASGHVSWREGIGLAYGRTPTVLVMLVAPNIAKYTIILTSLIQGHW